MYERGTREASGLRLELTTERRTPSSSRSAVFQLKDHYIGHLISPDKLSVAEPAADTFKTFTFQRTIYEGAIVPRGMHCLPPLRQNVHENVSSVSLYDAEGCHPDFYYPTASQCEVFEDLKERIISPPILALPRYGRPYMIDADADAYQLGCTLLQDHEDPNEFLGCR